MAGFGKALAQGLLGGLAGYGDYLQQEGVRRDKAASAEAESRREVALAEFRAQLQDDAASREDQRARGRIVLTGQVNGLNTQAEIAARASADAANDDREYQTWTKKNATEFAQWKAKTGIELSNAQKLESFKAEKQAELKAKEEGLKPVGDDIDEATGTRVLFYRDQAGNTRTFDTGVVVQGKSETNPITGEVTRQTSAPTKTASPGWRDEPAAPRAAPSGNASGGKARTTLDIAMDQLATDYASGKPLVVGGRKLSIQEAQALARRRYGG